MDPDETFRWLFVAIFVAVLATSITYRRKARRSGEMIPRAREGPGVVLARVFFAALLYLPMLAYMIHPPSMAWAGVRLPEEVRWAAAAVGLAMLPFLVWTLRSIGPNISETVLTKRDHALVTHGPYRWVRHPLYATATVVFLALGVLAANAFIMAMALIAAIAVVLWVIPKEEARLEEKFGADYRAYRKRSGRLMPHAGGRGESGRP